MTYDLCIDIGGTFTDLYIRGDDGTADSFKAPTTPDDFTEGLFKAVEKAATAKGTSVAQLLGQTDRFVHGTTVSTNAIIEGQTAETALITTEGFRDVLLLRPEIQKDTYEWKEFPAPFIPRWLTYTVEERVTPEGVVETELHEASVREIVGELADRGVEAVAVSLLWAHANPSHERRIAEIIDDIAPTLHYSLSHEVNPVIREHRRTSTTAIDASIHGIVNSYLSKLSGELSDRGFEGFPLIITANGGVMRSAEIAERGVWTVDSGPTMLPVAARYFVESELNETNVVALDMGGTSLDMCVVSNGTIPRETEAEVGDHYVLGIDKVDVKSIGSGGGSIAWVDDGGLLQVGPESAGADPGPVCYGQGNEEPTVTDAALALGYLDPEYFLGGDMSIDRTAAEDAIVSAIAEPLGQTTTEAAYSIYGTTVQNMVNGVKNVTIERGIDPRNFVLSGGGGALGMFAVEIARELGIDEVLLPAEAGVVSAIGGLSTDIRRDYVASEYTDTERFDYDGVNTTLASLEADAEDFLDRADIPQNRREMTFYAEARYPQQIAELQVQLPTNRIGEGDLERIVDRFHRAHDETFGYNMDDERVEFLKMRVEANGGIGNGVDRWVESTAEAGGAPERYGRREAYFGAGSTTGSAFKAASLAPGHTVDGPAFLDGENTTIVLPPGCEMSVTGAGNYHIAT